MVGREVILFPRKLDLHRPVRLLCEEGGNEVLPFDSRLVAEVSADVMGQHPDLVDLQFQRLGDVGPQTEGTLVGIPDRQPFSVPARHRDTGFHGRMLDQMGLVSSLRRSHLPV